MKIICSLNSIYILWLSYAKDFACTSASAQTSRRPNVLLRHMDTVTTWHNCATTYHNGCPIPFCPHDMLRLLPIAFCPRSPPALLLSFHCLFLLIDLNLLVLFSHRLYITRWGWSFKWKCNRWCNLFDCNYVLILIRGVQYVLSMMCKCLMVKVWWNPEKRKRLKIGGIY